MSQPKIKISRRKQIREVRDMQHMAKAGELYVTLALDKDGRTAGVLYGPRAMEAFILENPDQEFEMKSCAVRRK